MEIACVIDSRLATLARSGRSGRPRPGRNWLADPVAAAERTEVLVRRLEAIGAAVESERAGEAFFALDGLQGIHGGDSAGVLAAARSALGEPPLRIGTAPNRFADRFGPLGLRARRLARGLDEPLHPRTPHEELAEQLELPEGTAGSQLERALALLVDRLLAAPQRRGRTLLGLRFGALLSAGGSWSVEQGLGRPTASARTLHSLLVPRLESLPGPVAALRLRVLGLGPPAADQIELAVGGDEPRRRRLGAAVREVRAAQGPEALLKVLPVDSASRVPERWAMLTPFPEL